MGDRRLNLLLDIGNTNLRWIIQDGPKLDGFQSVRHGGGAPLDLLAAWETLETPDRVLIGNVGGAAVGDAVARVVRAMWGLKAQFASTRAEYLGVRVSYADPSRFGVDRWLALLAAHGRGTGSSLVIDAGTAVTYDLLLDGGQHLGGLILPGIEMMGSGLFAGTGIPRAPLDASDPSGTTEDWNPWASDTGAAVTIGSVQALGALSDRLYDRLSEYAPGGLPTLLLTGGDSGRLAPAIHRPYELIPDLVLRGLARFADGA